MTEIIDPTARIAPTAVVGSPFRPLLDGRQVSVDRDMVIATDVWVGHFAIIGQGAAIDAGARIEDFAYVGPGSTLGARVVVTARSSVAIGATVGADSVIDGFVCERSQVGARCRIFGELIHRQIDPTTGWDDPGAEEPAPVVGDGAFVGWRAVVVGGVNVGAGAYVCAGAIVTKDVPPGYIAHGCNEFVHPNAWPGALAKSPFFRGSHARGPLSDVAPDALGPGGSREDQPSGSAGV